MKELVNYKILERYKVNKMILKTTDYDLFEYLENYRCSRNRYQYILDFLNSLGKFNSDIYLNAYDKSEKCIKATFFDLDNDIYIISIFNANSDEYNVIEKLTNYNHLKYNIKLLGERRPTKENVELCRYGDEYNFKSGKIITDNKSFLSVFFKNDITYQVLFDSFEKMDINALLSDFNEIGELVINKFLDIVKENITKIDITEVRVFENYKCTSDSILNESCITCQEPFYPKYEDLISNYTSFAKFNENIYEKIFSYTKELFSLYLEILIMKKDMQIIII